MMIKPTGDNIVIKLPKVEDKEVKTASGILIPKSSQAGPAKPDKGEVVAVGLGRILNNGAVIEPEVKVNDVVVFNKFAGTEIEANGEMYLVIKENDIIAIIKE